jgi:hypothetical protein
MVLSFETPCSVNIQKRKGCRQVRRCRLKSGQTLSGASSHEVRSEGYLDPTVITTVRTYLIGFGPGFKFPGIVTVVVEIANDASTYSRLPPNRASCAPGSRQLKFEALFSSLGSGKRSEMVRSRAQELGETPTDNDEIVYCKKHVLRSWETRQKWHRVLWKRAAGCRLGLNPSLRVRRQCHGQG